MSIGRLTVLVCDGCGWQRSPADNARRARALARMFGWHRLPSRRVETPFGVEVARGADLCPTCYVSRGRTS